MKPLKELNSAKASPGSSAGGIGRCDHAQKCGRFLSDLGIGVVQERPHRWQRGRGARVEGCYACEGCDADLRPRTLESLYQHGQDFLCLFALKLGKPNC